MPVSDRSPETPTRLADNIPLRLTAYYAVLAASAYWLVPRATAQLPALGATLASGRAEVRIGVAATAAFLLALPVAWVYMLTRERKGYRQTVVHTLVLLPMVVAGVAVLVKGDVALALSVAGIAAAVRFRNTLDDSKDAVYLLLSLGIGIGTAANAGIAFALSAMFNVAALVIFYTDFGRMPPALEGERARRQLERAMATANRTSQFVAQVDDAVLRELAPPQLDALAQRLRRRREESAPDLPVGPDVEFDARLRILTTDADAIRPVVEQILETRVKRWRADQETTSEMAANDGDGDAYANVVAYRVRWRKGTPPDAVLAAVREEGAPFVVRADVV